MTDPQMQNQPNPILNEDPAIASKLGGGSKGLIIGIIVAIIAIVFGMMALFNYNSSSKYQGMIQKIQSETKELQNVNNGS